MYLTSWSFLDAIPLLQISQRRQRQWKTTSGLWRPSSNFMWLQPLVLTVSASITGTKQNQLCQQKCPSIWATNIPGTVALIPSACGSVTGAQSHLEVQRPSVPDASAKSVLPRRGTLGLDPASHNLFYKNKLQMPPSPSAHNIIYLLMFSYSENEHITTEITIPVSPNATLAQKFLKSPHTSFPCPSLMSPNISIGKHTDSDVSTRLFIFPMLITISRITNGTLSTLKRPVVPGAHILT